MAVELYEAISNVLAKSECGVVEAIGVLEMVKQELLTAALDHINDGEEGDGVPNES